MSKKQNNQVSDARYIRDFHLRLKPEEEEQLRNKAESIGCTASQFIRLSVFGTDNPFTKKYIEKENDRCRTAAIRSLRNNFKRIAGPFNEYLSMLGTVSGTEANEHLLKTLSSMILSLQKDVNSLLASEGETEIHVISRVNPQFSDGVSDHSGKAFVEPNEPPKHYYYMERITLLGFIETEASVYNSQSDGGERIRMRVRIMRGRKDAKREVIYNVFTRKDGSLQYLKQGRQVYVEGTFDENDRGEKMVYADVVKLTTSQKQQTGTGNI